MLRSAVIRTTTGHRHACRPHPAAAAAPCVRAALPASEPRRPPAVARARQWPVRVPAPPLNPPHAARRTPLPIAAHSARAIDGRRRRVFDS